MSDQLFYKYDVPVPRYTSYPTVPYWSDSPTTTEWLESLKKHFSEKPSWSLYVHIPFCETLCTLGTFGVNATASDHVPSCEYDCPVNSYARDSDRICVADCESGLYGDPIKGKCYSNPFDCSDGYYANSVNNLCVLPADCQTVGTHYFAQN